ncbi:sensor histidine kinase N-terminal domain-containing protein [Gymnodinialimonas ceratoperidinii]|uniref:histidine kinase n=1 Tax=Gymnodinialimonas ceratoperidinii TaxID=2856823 RepID=A0A8F6YB67_9RHOB|nr:sensor histidine kinase N-terminal domain-containing protein [Gymnodinialimonas ceratoperidinii]QXT40659.1 sensor histidine kinase [Gymnodinialimonas ceratoperidinii]
MSQFTRALGFRPNWSIARKLTLFLAAIVASLALISWGMVTSFALEAAGRTQDNILAASATSIAETLRSEGGQVRLELPYAAFSMLGAISEDRVFYRVAAGDEVLTGYADLEGPEVTPGAPRFATLDYRDTPVRAVSVMRVILSNGEAVPVTVTVAQTRDGVQGIAAGLSRQAAVLSVVVFLLAVGMSAYAVRSSLMPLNTMAQHVATRGPSDLRPLRRRGPPELMPLVRALNRLMERLGASIRRSEDFIAEAAHRVRTPLAIVRTQAEIALHSVEEEAQKQTLRRVIRAVDDSSRSASQLLDHAMVSFRADDLAREPLDLPALTSAVAEALRPTAEMKDIDIALTLSEVTVEGDAILLQNALRNVLDNAIKYSPAETIVRVDVARSGGEARVCVRDEGPGFGSGPATHLTERFRRGDKVEGIVGSGLGLTIAEEAIRAHGGRLKMEKAQGGGACVRLILPAI